jgi:FkbM family methyltransferase
MNAQRIFGKMIQLSHLQPALWPKFLGGWSRRGRTGLLPCVLPRATRLVFIPLEDFYESYAFFAESHNGRAELNFFVRQLNSGDVVFDIGAFRGVYGVAAKAARNCVSVHSFEAIVENSRQIEHIARINRFQNFKVINSAVGASQSISGVFDAESGMFRDIEPKQMTPAVQINSITIDDYARLSGASPTVMKIDVEGFELDVLRGAKNCLMQYRPRLWLEVHPDILNAKGENWSRVMEFLQGLGYSTIEFYRDAQLRTRNLAFHVWCAP